MKIAGFVACLYVMGWATGMGCAEKPAPVAAEASYGAALLACVDKAATLAESKACRAAVDRQWGIVQTPTTKDGGR